MYKPSKNSDSDKIIDFTKFVKCENPIENQKNEAEKLQEEVNNFLVDKLGERYVLIYNSPLEKGSNIFFSQKFDPVEDLMPMAVRFAMCIADCYDLDTLNVASAIFNATYNSMLAAEEDELKKTCFRCDRFDVEDGCQCDGDCEHCEEE